MEMITEQQNVFEDKGYIPKTVKGIVERSYLQHRQDEEDSTPNGELMITDVSMAVSHDRDSNVIIDLVSVDPEAVGIVEEALYKPHTLRKNVIDLPPVEVERVARLEAVDVLSYLQKLERSRIEEKERLLNLEGQQLGDDEYE